MVFKPVVCAAALLISTPAFADELCGQIGSSRIFALESWSFTPASALEQTVAGFVVHLSSEKLRYTGPKPLTEVDGRIDYWDADKNWLSGHAIDLYLRIQPGAEYVQEGLWGPNTAERVWSADPATITTVVCVASVIYQDGTSQSFLP